MAPFAQITQGPATLTGTNTNKQALILDRQNNIVDSVGDSGVAQTLQTAIVVQGAQTALTAVTTAQNLFSKVLNAGILNQVLRAVYISGSFIYTTPGTTTPTLTIAVTLGGVTLCTITTSALSATASTNMPVNFWFDLMTITTGATGTLETHGQVNANLSANTPSAAITSFNDVNTAVSGAVNLQSALTLNVTVAASSAVSSIQLRQFTVEVTA
jgi:hypothetical protein